VKSWSGDPVTRSQARVAGVKFGGSTRWCTERRMRDFGGGGRRSRGSPESAGI
jgi:hypothetical protein